MGLSPIRVWLACLVGLLTSTLQPLILSAPPARADAKAVPALTVTGAAQAPRVPGEELWVRRHPGSGGSVAVSPDGAKLFVTGSTRPGDNHNYATVAYDAQSGTQLWVSTYDGPDNRDDTAQAVAVSPDGTNVFVTGESEESRGYPYDDYATIAYDASTGAQLWVSRYGQPNSDDAASSLGVSPDGSRVFVTGESGGPGATFDYATIAYDPSTGTQLWVSRYDGRGHFGDRAYSLGISPDGAKVFVTGASAGPDHLRDYANTVAYDAFTGAQLWVSCCASTRNYYNSSVSLGVSPDGSKVFVTGDTGPGENFDWATVAYDASTGTLLWFSFYNGPGNFHDSPNSLGVSPDGSKVFVTGQSSGPQGTNDYGTVAYDASTGKQLWVSRYNGGSSDVAYALRASPDGNNVFVTGFSYGPTDQDYATVAYDASTGIQQWVRRYTSTATGFGYDSGNDVAVSPDGSKVFVTGVSSHPRGGFDSATVAYSAI